MQWAGYWSTFLTYIIVLSTHTTLAYYKSALREAYELPLIVLGLIDACMYFGYVTGYIFRYICCRWLDRYYVFTVYCCFSSLLFAAITLPSFLDMGHGEGLNLLLLSLCYGIGLLQMPFFPTFYIFVTRFYSNQEHGRLIGLWGGCVNAGLLFGSLFPAFISDLLHWSWETSFLILSILLLVGTIITGVIMQRTVSNGNGTQNQQSLIDCTEYTEFVKKALSTGRYLHYLITLSIAKSIIFVMLYWLPVYLQDRSMQTESFLYPIVVNLLSIVGSFTVGRLYERSAGTCSGKDFLNYFLIVSALLATCCLAVMSWIHNLASCAILALLIVIGFMLGGSYTSYQTNECLALAGDDKRQVAMLNYLSSTLANFFIALLSLVMAVGLELGNDENVSQSHTSTYGVLFKVLCCCCLLLVFLFAIRLTFRGSNQDGHPIGLQAEEAERHEQ